jgi:Rad3-related DNA helicase
MKQHTTKLLDAIKEKGDIDTPEARDMLSLTRKVAKLDNVRGENWVAEHTGDHVSFDMVWVEPFMVEQDLIRGIPRVLLTSATINKKTLSILKIREYTYSEYPSTFSPSRNPVYFVPAVAVDHRITDAGFSAWLSSIDNIIKPRRHRKGLIHTVSYDRANRLCNTSMFRRDMMCHDKNTTKDIVDRFKRVEAPAVLVSPSMTTGWDFPYDECRWSIIGKVPFPDSRSMVMTARAKLDPDYAAYVTMQTVVQACGRGMRNRDDYCETFILDSHWGWFLQKYKRYAPKWFLASLKERRTLPQPLGGGEI